MPSCWHEKVLNDEHLRVGIIPNFWTAVYLFSGLCYNEHFFHINKSIKLRLVCNSTIFLFQNLITQQNQKRVRLHFSLVHIYECCRYFALIEIVDIMKICYAFGLFFMQISPLGPTFAIFLQSALIPKPLHIANPTLKAKLTIILKLPLIPKPSTSRDGIASCQQCSLALLLCKKWPNTHHKVLPIWSRLK